MSLSASILAARQLLQEAAHIAVLSGAGISAESGVPTFRDAQTGLWAHLRPEDLATEDAFRRHPQRVWDWYAERRASLAEVQPNAGHRALAEFQHRHPGRRIHQGRETPLFAGVQGFRRADRLRPLRPQQGGYGAYA